MKKGFIDELRWRGLLGEMSQGTEEKMNSGEMKVAYIGTDPTFFSLHLGHFCSFMMARLFQQYGGKPIILVGGATAMIGDPSFKSAERNSMDFKEVNANAESIKHQLSKIVDFSTTDENCAVMVNNHDWMKDMSFLDFLNDVGKSITVNYLMAKESVKKRLEREGDGISIQEFLYSPIQGNDFRHLYEKYNCEFQFCGLDQKGNCLTGISLIHKKLNKDAYFVACPLITDSSGKKIGKTDGNASVWLDRNLTTPYQMFQYFMNISDEMAEKMIKIFTLKSRTEIESIINEHKTAPHKRMLQSVLAKEVTTMVHSEEDYNLAVEASNILFGESTSDVLRKIDESTLLSVFSGVPTFEVDKSHILKGVKLTDLAVDYSNVFKSKGELRKLIQSGGISLNKDKVGDSDAMITSSDLLNEKYILIQKGKRSYSLLIVK